MVDECENAVHHRMGILLAEIQGLKEANANPNLEPGANMAIINQGLGLLDYEDQYYKDYFGWRKENATRLLEKL
nr:hypothetical protein [Betaproteobacteria bacterium]